MADHLPGAELVEIPAAGHGAHLTHPDAFASLVRRTADRALPA
jgi:pimeloyl-ACP methyl ester carboxylesterase